MSIIVETRLSRLEAEKANLLALTTLSREEVWFVAGALCVLSWIATGASSPTQSLKLLHSALKVEDAS